MCHGFRNRKKIFKNVWFSKNKNFYISLKLFYIFKNIKIKMKLIIVIKFSVIVLTFFISLFLKHFNFTIKFIVIAQKQSQNKLHIIFQLRVYF